MQDEMKVVNINSQTHCVPVWVKFIAADSDGGWWGYRDHPLQGAQSWYIPLVAGGRMYHIRASVLPEKHWSKTLLAV